MNFLKSCGRCVLPAHNSGICPVLKRAPSADDSPCHQYTRNIEFCPMCGNAFLSSRAHIVTSEKDPDTFLVICETCSNELGGCRTCQLLTNCSLEDDPSPNKYIQRETRQGNMIMSQTVVNPDFVVKHCHNCRCFSQEFGCLRQNQYPCVNWRLRE